MIILDLLCQSNVIVVTENIADIMDMSDYYVQG